MKLDEILNDKTIKQKGKVEIVSKMLLDKKLTVEELITYTQTAADTLKATCIESLEFASRQNASIATEKCLKFVIQTLTDDAPRVKWESAKVIGNIAHLFPTKLDKAIGNLLANSKNDGTVVRWASAYALGEILKLKTKHNKDLLPALEAISNRETDNAIKKKYLDAIKKTKK
ncbi:MAG: HEAT repeat domain-containing protein [Ginsengibacter sp.]